MDTAANVKTIANTTRTDHSLLDFIFFSFPFPFMRFMCCEMSLSPSKSRMPGKGYTAGPTRTPWASPWSQAVSGVNSLGLLQWAGKKD